MWQDHERINQAGRKEGRKTGSLRRGRCGFHSELQRPPVPLNCWPFSGSTLETGVYVWAREALCIFHQSEVCLRCSVFAEGVCVAWYYHRTPSVLHAEQLWQTARRQKLHIPAAVVDLLWGLCVCVTYHHVHNCVVTRSMKTSFLNLTENTVTRCDRFVGLKQLKWTAIRRIEYKGCVSIKAIKSDISKTLTKKNCDLQVKRMISRKLSGQTAPGLFSSTRQSRATVLGQFVGWEALEVQLSVKKNLEAVSAATDRWMMTVEKLGELPVQSLSPATFVAKKNNYCTTLMDERAAPLKCKVVLKSYIT